MFTDKLGVNIDAASNIDDHSQNDDSIRQDGVTIQAGPGSTINANSGNGVQHRSTKKGIVSALFQVLTVSIICDILICALVVWTSQSRENSADDAARRRHEQVQTQLQSISDAYTQHAKDAQKIMDELKESNIKAVEQAKEGVIWILRRDILHSIDYHETSHKITYKQYRRLKDQFDYYTQIGGNHDVKERFENFSIKIFGTKDIEMLSDAKEVLAD